MLALRAPAPLRMRVSMSATGSVIMSGSPAGLHESRDLPLAREIAQADAAHTEPTVEGPRPSAERTAIVCPDPELRGPGRFHHETRLRHSRTFRRCAVRPGTGCRARAEAPSPRHRSGRWYRSRSSVP